MSTKPSTKPQNPNFSSGPCAKRPGFSLKNLEGAPLGRSHRASIGKAKLKEVIDLTKKILGIPENYRVGIVPASDTGAVEMAMWSLLGAKGTDIVAFESFGEGWANDAAKQLKLEDLRIFNAQYGKLPNLSEVDTDRDVVFTWNGTTSGVKIPNGDWIKSDRKGLTICDATSAVFAMDLPWDKLDVTTWSWQKVMGGEAAHGMIVLSPNAVARLESYTPKWPMPKIFRLTSKGKLIEGIFVGETINTPSMLCVEDAIDVLKWMEQQGGKSAMIKRSNANLKVFSDWIAKTDWIDFLAESEDITSNTSVCLKIVDPWYKGLDEEQQQAKAKEIAKILESEKVAFDIGAYRDAPAGLRVWCGATVEANDVAALTTWLDWAYAEVKEKAKAA